LTRWLKSSLIYIIEKIKLTSLSERKKCMSIPHDEMPAQEFIDFVNFNTADEAKRCRILLAEVLLKLEKLTSRRAERNYE